MLMIKKQTEYLDYLFSHTAFRTHFYVHYETHMSIKDPNFEWTRMREIVPILNRVDKGNNYFINNPGTCGVANLAVRSLYSDTVCP